MRSSCVGVTGAGAVFAFPVAIADKLLSAVFAGQMVIGFPLHLLRVGVPPGVPALIGANAYRVLLTRARQGFIIYIPEGVTDDATRLPAFYDETFNYLKEIGIQEI